MTNNFPSLSLYNLSSMTFSSSILTKLCINVCDFNDCLDLLDGRLKQLTTFIVEVNCINDEIGAFYDMVSLCSMLLSFSKYSLSYPQDKTKLITSAINDEISALVN
jgi:hypothetical protein